MSDPAVSSAPEDPQQPEKLVPVSESIRYRRRAQQAEQRTEQLEQQLQETQTQLQQQLEQLAQAESQRDELSDHLARVHHEGRVDSMLREFGVIDTEAAALLLNQRDDLTPDTEDARLRHAIESLLTDRPYLSGQSAARLPEQTATGRDRAGGARVVEAARRAARSGDRRDVAEYLRLRRQLDQ